MYIATFMNHGKNVGFKFFQVRCTHKITIGQSYSSLCSWQ